LLLQHATHLVADSVQKKKGYTICILDTNISSDTQKLNPYFVRSMFISDDFIALT